MKAMMRAAGSGSGWMVKVIMAIVVVIEGIWTDFPSKSNDGCCITPRC